MKSSDTSILAINRGSSSIRFVHFPLHGESLERSLHDRIGPDETCLTFTDAAADEAGRRESDTSDARTEADSLTGWPAEQTGFETVGHRAVHDTLHAEPGILADVLGSVRTRSPSDFDILTITQTP